MRIPCSVTRWLAHGAMLVGLICLGQGAAWAQSPASAQSAAQGVLVLVSTGFGQAGIDNYVKGIYGALRAQGMAFTDIHIEYLDLVKNPDASYRQRMGDLLAVKHPASRIGVIVAVQAPAANFLVQEGARIAPAAPVLVAQSKVPLGTSGRHFFVQLSSLDFAGTLERALELFPKTKRVVLLSGVSVLEQERIEDARRQFAPWQDRLEFEYVDGLAFGEMERRLAATPEHTVIIAPGINRDVKGQVFVPIETIVKIAKSANAPVFPLFSVSIGQGPVGGMVSILEDEGKSMARSVVELLRRSPDDRSPFTVQTAKSVPLFDWQQIERWGGDPGKLPADTVYVNRPSSLWGQYKAYVISGVVVILVLSILAGALALQSRRRLLAERSLRASQTRYKLLADNMSDVLWTFNLESRKWEYVSPSVQRLLGYSVDEFMQKPLRELMAAQTYAEVTAEMATRIRECLSSPNGLHTYTNMTELRCRDGTMVWIESVTHYLRDARGHLTLLGVTRDIRQRMLAQQEIQKLAFYDPLTQLPNRKLLLDRIQHALGVSARSLRTGALLFIDLDHFKTLNDTRGHDMGDLLLRQIAQRLNDGVREGDTVARLGGDEFVVMLEDLDEDVHKAAKEARAIGEKLLVTLNRNYDLDGFEYHSTASIGIALFNGHAETVEELLKRADLAMYRAKSAGRNALRFFDPEMQSEVTQRAVLEAELRKALEAKQMLLHYQPQVDSHGRITGAEALVRWQHPQRGLVSPAEFIPLAEATGLILPLGHWVLETACEQLVAWSRQPLAAHLTLAVNVSARQFRHVDFVAQVLGVIKRTGVRPDKLKLELTESLLVHDLEDTVVKMMLLKVQGIGFSLDDFGTGYSSLAYLKRLPLDQLKIDQSFVRDVLTDPNDAAIARTVMALGLNLGLSVIAEGVETEGQREFLAQHGCLAYQGYLFSRPLPVAAFDQFLASRS